MKELKIKLDIKDKLKLDEILKIQGDLKELPEEQYEKFKKALLEVGFCSPFHIWKNKQYNECLDGTQRLKTLLKMKQEGIKMPDEFPVIYVKAKSKKEARKILLSLASNYGKANRQGLDAFLIDSDFVIEDVDWADFPEFDLGIPNWDKEGPQLNEPDLLDYEKSDKLENVDIQGEISNLQDFLIIEFEDLEEYEATKKMLGLGSSNKRISYGDFKERWIKE